MRGHLRAWGRTAALAGIVLAGAPLAAAQEPDTPATDPARPVTAARSASQSRQGGLALRLSAYGGVDDNVTIEERNPVDPRFQTAGSTYGTRAEVAYRGGGDRFAFGASADSGLHILAQPEQFTAHDHSVGFDATAALGRRYRLQGFQRAGYASFYRFSPFIDVPAAMSAQAGSNYAITDRRTISFDTRVALQRALGRRWSLSFDTSWHRVDLQRASGVLTELSAGGHVQHPISRYAALRTGYTFRVGDFGQGGTGEVRTHDIDVGVDYGRPLSFSRRTRVSASTGSSILTRRLETAQDERRFFRLLLAAGVAHEFRRTWAASVNYGRGVQYVEGFAAPFYADTLDAMLGGRMSRKTGLIVNTAYSKGSLAIGARDAGFDTYMASLRIDRAVGQRFALFIQPSYYRYTFGRLAVLPVGMPREIGRSGLRGGVTFATSLTSPRRRP